ncbi:cell division protein FtsL [Oceanobacillus sp. 143]|jgi:cell division protein FtsL|uniref:Cell division protein FtsL n=1 Tax=Oceanobacillus zhaokaii TaxID=2052660 RepID=A0A345PG61_9BACI|nr:cell division protein FtsL [Oceanobacillus zhaokaii]AXI08991.1 cell division protein FtsL [Oceanobacillus zhaokaii]QGS68604.1 cell division protein FtsL [Oceanobacillus sp. 143]
MNTNYARSWQQSSPQQAPKKDKKVAVKVKKQGWVTKGEKVIYSIFSVALIAISIFIVSFSSSTDALNRELQTLEKTAQSLELKNEALQFEKKELSRPERIIEVAKKNGLKIQDAEVKQAHAFNN